MSRKNKIILIILSCVLAFLPAFAQAKAMAPSLSNEPVADKKMAVPPKVDIHVDTYGEVHLKWKAKKGTTYIISRVDKNGREVTLAKTKLGELKDVVRHKGEYTYSVLPVCGSMPVSVASLSKVRIKSSDLGLKISGRKVTIIGSSAKNADGFELVVNGKKKNISKKTFTSEGEPDTITQYKIRAYKLDKDTGDKLFADSITRYVYISDYDPDKAIEYARRYALNNNPDFRDYNPDGGDCANFVSQCLSAGGMAMTDEWNYLSKGTSAWISVKSMFAFFSSKYEVIYYPTYEDIEKGDIVMKRDLSHVVICSSDEEEVPLICAHNDKHLDSPLYGDISGWIVIKPASGAVNTAPSFGKEKDAEKHE